MKTVLITGATGAIGSTLVPLLLKENGTELRLIIRTRSEEHLHKRLGALFSFWEIDREDPSISKRLQVFCGDVCMPSLGLEEGAYLRLAEEVTHVIHTAGNVKLNQPVEDAKRDALDSARQIVAFANACRKRGPFVKLDFVSTVGVVGMMPGLLPEEPLRSPREFHNTYEAAKAEAEDFLLEEMQRGLPATVHRPSMVVGHSETGKIIRFQVFYHLSEFMLGKKTRGIVPDPGQMKLDIIPVDYVATAIKIASSRPSSAGRIFHLCSGPAHAPRLVDLAETLRRIWIGYGEKLPRLHLIKPSRFQRILSLISPFVPSEKRPALNNLPYFLAYLEEKQTFDNTKSDVFFVKEGLRIRPVSEYLGKIVEYYRNNLPNKGRNGEPYERRR